MSIPAYIIVGSGDTAARPEENAEFAAKQAADRLRLIKSRFLGTSESQGMPATGSPCIAIRTGRLDGVIPYGLTLVYEGPTPLLNPLCGLSP